ncbi:MAG: hypothetical protein HC921_14375 [Synechococcaceae cyanobacterium SM2_3_1]|nr:hypothetical protein [Synechococcaceae cyanobacterium SM2_3_1]
MGRIFKFILAPFNFIGILLGGLWDFVAGAFRSSDPAEPAPVKVPSPPASVESSPPSSASAPASRAMSQQPLRSQSTASVQVETPFEVNAVPRPRPTRRPGKTMSMFKAMARDLQISN